MPPLWKFLRRPHPWLALVVACVVLALVDTQREPSRQLTSRAYVGSVRLYQRFASPLLASHIRCRYQPTCSEYSIGAVARHGIGAGLVMSWRRVRSCTESVPFGTADPVR
jgi:putative membrane protein insertion efficiency factor